MTKNELQQKYFEWMYRLVHYGKFAKNMPFRKLLARLHEIYFTIILPMDGNREEDGINLRYRFGYECGCEDSIIASCLDQYPCSVLEVIVALSLRCEEHIMDDPDFGNRTGLWFLNMISNLGLMEMTDVNFDRDKVDQVISVFLNREYEPNGKGGLFIVDDCPEDMRSIEIWCQMGWYLKDFL